MPRISLIAILVLSVFGRALSAALPAEWLCEGRVCGRGVTCCCGVGACASDPFCVARDSADPESVRMGQVDCHCERSVASNAAVHPAVVPAAHFELAEACLPSHPFQQLLPRGVGPVFAIAPRGPPTSRPDLLPVGLRAPPIS